MNILRTRKFDWRVNDTGWLRRVKVFINSMIFPINYSLGFKCKLYYDIGLSWMNRSCSTVMKKKKGRKEEKEQSEKWREKGKEECVSSVACQQIHHSFLASPCLKYRDSGDQSRGCMSYERDSQAKTFKNFFGLNLFSGERGTMVTENLIKCL